MLCGRHCCSEIRCNISITLQNQVTRSELSVGRCLPFQKPDDVISKQKFRFIESSYSKTIPITRISLRPSQLDPSADSERSPFTT